MTTRFLLFAVVLLIVSLSFFLSQASSNTRKARSCTGSNEPFSHIDQPLPDPISPWTCSSIEPPCPLYPPTHTPSIHLSPPSPTTAAPRPRLPVSSLAPGRRVCTMEIKQRETERKRESGGVSVFIICVDALSVSSASTRRSLSLPGVRSPWRGV